jgi:hypothetical protein
VSGQFSHFRRHMQLEPRDVLQRIDAAELPEHARFCSLTLAARNPSRGSSTRCRFRAVDKALYLLDIYPCRVYVFAGILVRVTGQRKRRAQ